jgi:hypothetical protein
MYHYPNHCLRRPALFQQQIVPKSTVIKHVKSNSTMAAKQNQSTVSYPRHALPSAHLTDFAGLVFRGAFCLSWETGGAGVVRSSESLSPSLLSSSSPSSASPTPNNSSRSSHTLASAKLSERARALPFLLLLFCGNNADGGVSGLL